MIPAPAPHLCAIHGRCARCGRPSEVIATSVAGALLFLCRLHAQAWERS